MCRCSIWANFTSCVASSGCTLDDIDQYRLSLGDLASNLQQNYSNIVTVYQFICSRTEGTTFVTVASFERKKNLYPTFLNLGVQRKVTRGH